MTLLYQRGNALFLILIAVALFAALSYAITQSSRGGGSSADNEEQFLSSAQLTQSIASLATTVQRMRLADGTPLDDITFHTVGGKGSILADSTPCSSGTTCVFAAEGGGAAFPEMPSHIEKGGGTDKPIINLYELADNAKIDGVANNQPVLLAVIWNLSKKACENLNDGLGIANMPEDTAFVLGTAVDAAPGEMAACYHATNAAPVYIYYHVLGTP